MKKFNLHELVSQLQEDHREFDIGDTVAVHFKGKLQPIKINGIAVTELKIFKGSFCIYDVYDEKNTSSDYNLDIEMLAIEEYSDSAHSIYIDSDGKLDTYEYENIATIEIGNFLTFKVENNKVTHYHFKEVL